MVYAVVPPSKVTLVVIGAYPPETVPDTTAVAPGAGTGEIPPLIQMPPEIP